MASEEENVAQLTPDGRDRARQRVGSATASLAVLAAGAAGAGSILAWHSTTEAAGTSVSTGTSDQSAVQPQLQQQVPQQGDDAEIGDDDNGGGSLSFQGGGPPPQGSLGNVAPPGAGSGGGVVRSQGS